MQGPAGIRASMVDVAALACRPTVAGDAQLLEEAECWEELGRLVDARRVAMAGEIAWRSREQLRQGALAKRQGDRSDAELLSRLLRVSLREAHRRIGLGLRVRPRTSLDGEELPGRYPQVAAALQAGELALDAARVIVDALGGGVRRRAGVDALRAAEEALVESGKRVSPDLLQVQAVAWQTALDPDGAEPDDGVRQRKRSFAMGATGLDGMTRSAILSPPEETALIRAMLNAHRRGVNWAKGSCDDCEDDPEWHEAAGDERSKKQFDFDTVMGVLAAGVRAEQDGDVGSGRSPFEVVVQATAADLERGRGAGWADDVLARIPIPSVQRLQCSGRTRLLVIGDHAEPLYLGKRVRLFNRAQRRALAARDGGCAFPGCRAPVAWTEGHHIRWYDRDDGPTDVDNGVLLCSYHHHLIHSTDRWEIRMHEHVPHLVPKRWRGAPLPRHRMQQHPIRAGGEPPGRDRPAA